MSSLRGLVGILKRPRTHDRDEQISLQVVLSVRMVKATSPDGLEGFQKTRICILELMLAQA